MDDKIYFLTKELKNTLDNDERIVRLNELEKAMNDNFGGVIPFMEKVLNVDIERLRELYLED